MNPFTWMKRVKHPKRYTLIFYMKSGNRIVTEVSEFNIKNRGDDITAVSFTPCDPANGLMISTLCLSQIEGVVVQ